jgi:hypothetical protein
MRSIKLTPAIAAAVSLLALAPAVASATHGHQNLNKPKQSGGGGCRINIVSEPHVITSGESVQLFGALRCHPGGPANEGQTVTVFERAAGQAAFQTLGTPTTGPAGFYSIVAPNVTANTVYYASAVGVRSENRKVRVAPQVTVGKAPTPPEGAQLRTGRHNRVTFAGNVSPADENAELILQRENAVGGEEWHPIQRGFVGAGGAFSITHTFVVPGDANIRVLVRTHGQFTVRGISNTLSYEISQAENPLLTLNSSADPIPFGQSMTLSGVLKGGANQKVILLSHPRGSLPFTKVGEASTNGNGEYSFLEQPPQNTSYRVTGASLSSAVLFEGVKYVLTAGVSATTVASGQPLTFSGTVIPTHPEHPGHVVYLERENAFGGGFHVVDVGTVEPDSAYSIVHSVFGAGKQVFRVRVPGDPQNQAVSSSPFTIEVTPAPPGSLKPLPPSKQPSEGKI